MIRITAINDESEIDDEDENQVTKEAEVNISLFSFRAHNLKTTMVDNKRITVYF